ncbi:hypothetical protein O6H91_18G062800 [Diphasiastrum complanatum]|uniref:Uncharacterized protein n=1 Tax=Diphasiastrum complanatum TaxID=34168 RepID=A0ACC2B1Z3_DIPCM|nr:hypothetical protein O6H91_18G062800 [Diphasiastrum complanatum]
MLFNMTTIFASPPSFEPIPASWLMIDSIKFDMCNESLLLHLRAKKHYSNRTLPFLACAPNKVDKFSHTYRSLRQIYVVYVGIGQAKLNIGSCSLIIHFPFKQGSWIGWWTQCHSQYFKVTVSNSLILTCQLCSPSNLTMGNLSMLEET